MYFLVDFKLGYTKRLGVVVFQPHLHMRVTVTSLRHNKLAILRT